MPDSETAKLSQQNEVAIVEGFNRAFVDLYPAVIEQAKKANTKVSGYPELRWRNHGMPYFTETGYWENNALRNFKAAISGMSLLGGAFDQIPADQQGPIRAFGELLQGIEAMKQRVDNPDKWFLEYEAKSILEEAFLRYLYLFGVEDLNAKHFWQISHSFHHALISENLQLAMVVPILMHKFDCDRYPLSPETFIVRMREPFQKGRAVASYWSTGVPKNVAACATHAFVSTRWNILNGSASSLQSRLTEPTDEAFQEIEQFFAALRVATDAVSGYAQVIFVPRGWSYKYKWDLPTMYASEHRRYPVLYDREHYGNDHVRQVSRAILPELKRVYTQIRASNQNNMELALRRLNACVARDDDVDAILDAIIGIELLLGDKNDSITFKLRIRVAGLAKLTQGRFNPEEAFKVMGQLYETRSSIVHGSAAKNKKTKAFEEDRRGKYQSQRDLATTYLRMCLETLLEHSRYRVPANIDRDLLINFNAAAQVPAQPDLPI